MRRFIVAWAISAIAVLWPVCVSAEVQDNEQIAHKIHDLLKSSGQMTGSSFIIKYQDGTACLEGRVGSEEQKALALSLTGQVPEITEVVDHLRVEPAKKTTNPVVRLLTKPFEKPQPSAEADSEEPEVARPKKSGLSSWFSGPSVRKASAPQPRADEVVDPPEFVAAEVDPTLDDGSVFPESLEPSSPAESTNPLVRQAANLRTIFRRGSQPARNPVVSTMESEPRTMPQASTQCVACNAATVRSTPMPRMTQVSNTKRYRTTGSSRSTSSAQSQPAQAGRVRMVPMMEMPDGRLVPIQQAKRAPLGKPISGQQVSSQRRGRATTANKSRGQNLARKQEVIDGPLDGEPGGPLMGAPPAGVAPAGMPAGRGPLPAYVPGVAAGVAPAYYDQPHMPNYAWPSYAAHPNYAGLTYPRQYSPTAWPYIGPFYPYPQVPLGWRKVTLEWDDGWWFLDFDDTNRSYSN
jgi:hypothetical protein